MEKQIEAMRGTISALKQQKKEKPPKKAARQQPTPTASSSNKPAKAAASSSKKATTMKKSGKKSAAVPGDDDVLTFEQKKELSEAIQTLDGQKLERVIQIIHEGVPEIRDVCSLPFPDPITITNTRVSFLICRAPRRLNSSASSTISRSGRSDGSLKVSPSYSRLPFSSSPAACHDTFGRSTPPLPASSSPSLSSASSFTSGS